MRRENKGRYLIEQLEHTFERREYFDVRVKVDDVFVAALGKMPEHERLDGHVKLHDVVAKREFAEVRNAQRVGRDHFADTPQ